MVLKLGAGHSQQVQFEIELHSLHIGYYIV